MTWSGENQRWKINGALEWYFCFVIWLPVNEQVLWNSPSIPLAFSIPVTRVPNQLTYSSITGRDRGNLWDTNIIWSTNCFIDWVTMEVEETPRAVEWPKEHCKIHQPLTSSRGCSFINVCQREIAPRRAAPVHRHHHSGISPLTVKSFVWMLLVHSSFCLSSSFYVHSDGSSVRRLYRANDCWSILRSAQHQSNLIRIINSIYLAIAANGLMGHCVNFNEPSSSLLSSSSLPSDPFATRKRTRT